MTQNPFRKIILGIGLVVLVVAIAALRANMTSAEDGSADWPRRIFFVALLIIPALISEHLWRKLQPWLRDQRLAAHGGSNVQMVAKTRQRALLQYEEITSREADHEHERQRRQAIYERSYNQARNDQDE